MDIPSFAVAGKVAHLCRRAARAQSVRPYTGRASAHALSPSAVILRERPGEDCYDLLGSSSRVKGYKWPDGKAVTKAAYKEAFRESYPTKVVCPYCDGDIGTAELDHYYSKSLFPLLACSPWNLFPVCKSCNDCVCHDSRRRLPGCPGWSAGVPAGVCHPQPSGPCPRPPLEAERGCLGGKRYRPRGGLHHTGAPRHRAPLPPAGGAIRA